MAHCEPGIVNLWNLCGGEPFCKYEYREKYSQVTDFGVLFDKIHLV